jgi:predicted HAD superfamily Cof-like phosphohydrolase
MSHLDDVRAFQQKFDIEYVGPPRVLVPTDLAFRINTIIEEAGEFGDACLNSDLSQAIDALADLEFFLQGTILLCGFREVYERAWQRVCAANMEKVKATVENPGKRNFPGDIVKPPGWQHPDMKDLFE